ncbi:glycosyltransferase family 39 protein [Rhodococcus sp. G-MC3]|uniref:ArnT family glycosyltransferase n=1 Tax=Rhodococcus sp. G-MC3 TaxID=3046209 RepID=UPI0024B97F57|nr:glycosyltransferase family 39 protein [Rhodococcus sp. G-MC3]MDJ0394071.1 glycosyltransferase family 39 protein [Rhodococcus sp. G-MC3]
MSARPGLFFAAFAGYLAIGLTLSLRFGYMLGDALARTSAAQSVLLSRDPHVSAIGFIFTPLTALLQLPLVALSAWWTGITRWNISGIAVSALFMAGTVMIILGICRDRGLTGRHSSLIAVLFAINPMILFYGANGMSEAVFLFFTCWAVRRLIRWVDTDDVHDLIVAGIALALAYLTRYDGVVAIAGAAFLVAGVTLLRCGRGSWRTMRRQALLDAVLVAGPGFVAFVVWSVTSWLITGEALAQLSSSYGNAAILEQSGGSTGAPLSNAVYAVAAIIVLGPILPLVLPATGVLARARRDLGALVAPVVFGAILAFQAASYISGSTFGFLRFYICAIPLAVVALIQIVPGRAAVRTRRPGAFRRERFAEVRVAPALIAATVVLSVLAIPVTGWAMLRQSLSSQQYALGHLLDDRPQAADAEAVAAQRILASFSTERKLAAYLDRQDLPDGSIIVDTVYGFAVLAASAHPTRFVVPSDQDFTTILNDPAAAGVRFMLTVPNTGRGQSDALNRRYPSIYDNGGMIATLDYEVPNTGADQPNWRVYRIGS